MFEITTTGSRLLDQPSPFGKHHASQQPSHTRDDGRHEVQRRFLEPPPHISTASGFRAEKHSNFAPGGRHRGTFLGLSKGGTANFGFIKPETDGQNVFVHGSNLAEDLQAGQIVDYELAPHEQV